VPAPRVKSAQSPTKGCRKCKEVSVTVRLKEPGKKARSYTKRVKKAQTAGAWGRIIQEKFWKQFVKGKR
jgi:hypothetical protein